MRRKQKVILMFLLLFIFVFPNPVKASWVSLSTDDLIQKADVILIGDILGSDGEGKGNPNGIDNYWMTLWNIKVQYYLKGNEESDKLIVVTPGALNKSQRSSLDYRLDQWGPTVIMFLRERDGLYEPISPQGVITLEKINYGQNLNDPVNGGVVLKKFRLTTDQNSDIEKYILENSKVTVPKNVPSKHLKSNQFVPKQGGISTIILVAMTLPFFALIIHSIRKRKS